MYKFVSWHSGFNYFIGQYQKQKVFVKVCVGEYDTIEAEGKMKEYNELGFFPKVITYSVSNINYIVTEFISTKRMSSSMPLELKRSIATQAENILEQLQENGIVHRDIRPENLMLTKDNRLLLFDFGWALYRDYDYKRSSYPFIEKILNIDYRTQDGKFDDAVSMYLSLREIFGGDRMELLVGIKKRFGIFEV